MINDIFIDYAAKMGLVPSFVKSNDDKNSNADIVFFCNAYKLPDNVTNDANERVRKLLNLSASFIDK